MDLRVGVLEPKCGKTSFSGIDEIYAEVALVLEVMVLTGPYCSKRNLAHCPLAVGFRP
ncbi:MAG: hypothetical protein ACXQTW_08035 [Candidatus Methanospirareceae archaeon]